MPAIPGYNRFPDEKGTERPLKRALTCLPYQVTIVSPMKRGLKAIANNHPRCSFASYNRFPDEKGTESINQPITIAEAQRSYNRFPDEKGTERARLDSVRRPLDVTIVSPMKRGLKDTVQGMVTIVSPMKRGLKVPFNGLTRARGTVTIVSPMKRGLKGRGG